MTYYLTRKGQLAKMNEIEAERHSGEETQIPGVIAGLWAPQCVCPARKWFGSGRPENHKSYCPVWLRFVEDYGLEKLTGKN